MNPLYSILQGPLPTPYFNTSLFVHLPPTTRELRRSYAPVTSILNKIKYCGGFLAKLLVTYQQKIIPIMTPNDSYKKLTNWGLLPIPPTSSPFCSFTNSSSPTVLTETGVHRLTTSPVSVALSVDVSCLSVLQDFHFNPVV